MKRPVSSLNKYERQWLKRRMCGFCEIGLLSSNCGALSGLYTLPVIEGVRDKEEIVDFGPRCDMDEKRGNALKSYKPRLNRRQS